jgi:CheY-like chemotaxis protein
MGRKIASAASVGSLDAVRPTMTRVTGQVRRVLVVDDDELLREVAKASLELVAGWSVSTAASGVEAHEKARTEQPDAIMLDVMMPGQDGPTTFAELRRDAATADIPVIFLTAKNNSLSWTGGGPAGVIAKPFDAMRLAAQVSELLGWQE